MDLSNTLFNEDVVERDVGMQNDVFGSVYWHAGYKYIRFPNGREELYYLAGDMAEQHDLAQTDPELTQAFSELYIEWCQRGQDERAFAPLIAAP